MELDDWIENRILFRAGQHNLPGGNTYAYANTPHTVLATIEAMVERQRCHRPVLTFIDTQDRWTVLGTERIISKCNGSLNSLTLARLKDIEPRDPGCDKMKMEHLRLRAGFFTTCIVWAPPGGEFFALWNILQMLPFESAPKGSW